MENNIRKGRCRNYGDCDKAGQEFSIEEGKPFECPECHQPLMPLDGPKNKAQKKKGGMNPLIFVVVGIVIIGIIAAIVFLLGGSKDDEVVVPVVNETPVDSVETVQEAITNRNDTLVIKIEGQENMPQEVEEVVVEEPETAVEEVAESPVPATKPTQTASPKLSYGTWTGSWRNGKPHGTGTLTYSTSQTIDPRDPKGRVAQPGEYIVGEWDNGHLVQGRWFKKDGSKEAIIIGKAG